MDFVNSEKLGMLKNIVITAGHYGSGKTNIAVNLASAFANAGFKSTIADLDIVNPYFRAADAVEMLENQGVRCLIGEYANSNVDIPAIPKKLPSVFLHKKNTDEYRTILDVGGDEGAVAIGMYSQQIAECGYDMIYTVNCFRPLTASPHDAADLLQNIEGASRLKCTYIVNNSNIGRDTTAYDIETSVDYAASISEITKIPVLFTSYIGSIIGSVPKISGYLFNMINSTKQIF